MTPTSPAAGKLPPIRVGYVVEAFPQLSESFIENEIRAPRDRGADIEVASLAEPAPGLVGPTELPAGQRHVHARELYLRTSGLWAKCRDADAVITVCDHNVAELDRVCEGRLPERLHVVRCGVDPDRFPARDAAPDRDGFHLVSVGRLVPKKGFADLIDAVALLAADGADVTLDIIGSGPLDACLRRRVNDHDLGERIALVGSLPPVDVSAAIRDADAFVLANVIAPDGDRDSMPVVTKEPMASAVPVITTDAVGNTEMVDETVGRLVPPHDPASIAAAVTELAALAPEERHRMGMAGRGRVEQEFSLGTETAKLHRIFHDLA